MKIEKTLLLTTILAGAMGAATGAMAQNCSGGADGGMDATGNQCSVTAPAATDVDSAMWQLVSSRLAPAPTSRTGFAETILKQPVDDTRPVNPLMPAVAPTAGLDDSVQFGP